VDEAVARLGKQPLAQGEGTAQRAGEERPVDLLRRVAAQQPGADQWMELKVATPSPLPSGLRTVTSPPAGKAFAAASIAISLE